MLSISQNDEKKIIIKNINNISENDEKKLLGFLSFNSQVFKDIDKKKDEIHLYNENLSLSINQLEKFLKKQNILFRLDETISKFKNKQEHLTKKIIELRNIGKKLNTPQNISQEFELEYEEFRDFCQKNFPRNHIPYENQIKSAFFHLKMQKSCNFSAPGTGKTTIVYALFNWLKNKQNNEVDAIFIIGPIASLHSWKNEYKECFGRNPHSLDFNNKNFRREINFSTPHNSDIIYFLNYERVKSYKKELIKFFKKYRILLVLDEAHRIKNPKSQRTNYLSEILNNSEVFVPYQIILTGTPIPNGYENLYSYFDLTKTSELPILSKSYEELKKIGNEDENEIEEVFQEVSPFFCSLRKKDMEDFKEPNSKPIDCKMEDFQAEFFNTLKRRLVDYWNSELDQKILLDTLRSKIIRLMQIQTDIRMLLQPVNKIIFDATTLQDNSFLEEQELNNEIKDILEEKTFESDMEDFKIPISEIKSKIEKYNKSGQMPDKYKRLLEKVKELIASNKKVIIWSNWVYCINEIDKLLEQEGINHGLLYGAIPYEQREENIEAFNDKENQELMVLVANPASVGESISLHKVCQNAIYFDINYNVTNHFQSKDRIHRCGMPKGNEQVTYYYLLAERSIETKILKHIQNKEKRMNEFLDKKKNLFIFRDSDFNNMMPDINDMKETIIKN